MNIQELLQEKNEVTRLEREILLAHVLNISRLELITKNTLSIKAVDQRRFYELIKRRSAHEPIAYLIGAKEFFGLSFQIESGALIPRPETELIIELALQHLKFLRMPVAIVDVGTGSGAIAVTLAKHTNTDIIATEFSPAAFDVAQKNITHHNVANQVKLFFGSGVLPLFDHKLWREDRKFLVLANLPYLPTAVWEATMPDIKNFEPREALDGGPDGLDLYRMLLNQLLDVPTGISVRVWCEIDPTQTESLPLEIKKRFPKTNMVVWNDLAELPRVIGFDL